MTNKKLMSKVLVLALALVMVFTMTASAFASNAGVNVSVRMYGEEYIAATVSANDIAAHLETGKNHLYDTTGAASTVPNVGYTAADALIEAWYQFYDCDSYDSDQIAYYWDNNPWEGLPGLAFTKFDGLGNGDSGNYYFVETTTDEAGNTLYWYYWEGETWNMSIDNIAADDVQYATYYGISSISNIVFDYAPTRTDNFSTTTPITGAL